MCRLPIAMRRQNFLLEKARDYRLDATFCRPMKLSARAPLGMNKLTTSAMKTNTKKIVNRASFFPARSLREFLRWEPRSHRCAEISRLHKTLVR